MTLHSGVSCSVQDGIGRIVLATPARANMLSLSMTRALDDVVREVLAAEPRVLLLSGAGPVFCAGCDVDELMAAGPQLDTYVDRVLAHLHPAILRIATSPLPVVAATRGLVGGAGVGLALCADFVLADWTTDLQTGYATLGLSPDAGTSHFLTRRVGSQRAKQWLMRSEVINAEECLRVGAIDAIYSPEQLDGAAVSLALRLAHAAPGSLAKIKALCDGAARVALDEQLDLERQFMSECARSGDALEGVAAYAHRRAPQFASV